MNINEWTEYLHMLSYGYFVRVTGPGGFLHLTRSLFKYNLQPSLGL